MLLGVHLLLRRRPLDQHRRLRIAERAADELAHAAEVGAEGRLDVGLAGQQVADHRHVVAVDLGKQQRRAAVELLHHAGDFEIGVDRRRVGLQPAAARPCAPSAERKRVSSTEFERLNAVSWPGQIRHHSSGHPTSAPLDRAENPAGLARARTSCEPATNAGLLQARGAPRRRTSGRREHHGAAGELLGGHAEMRIVRERHQHARSRACS